MDVLDKGLSETLLDGLMGATYMQNVTRLYEVGISGGGNGQPAEAKVYYVGGRSQGTLTPDQEFLSKAFLEPIDAETVPISEAYVLADWLDDHDDHETADKVRAALSPASLRAHFVAVRQDTFAGRLARRPADAGVSRLEEARRRQRFDVLASFQWFLRCRAVESINAFTRARIREQSLIRRIMSPEPISASDETMMQDVVVGTPIKVVDATCPG